MIVFGSCGSSTESKITVKKGHTPKERRLGTHLPFIGR